jgi:hypothetical protein
MATEKDLNLATSSNEPTMEKKKEDNKSKQSQRDKELTNKAVTNAIVCLTANYITKAEAAEIFTAMADSHFGGSKSGFILDETAKDQTYKQWATGVQLIIHDMPRWFAQELAADKQGRK